MMMIGKQALHFDQLVLGFAVAAVGLLAGCLPYRNIFHRSLVRAGIEDHLGGNTMAGHIHSGTSADLGSLVHFHIAHSSAPLRLCK